ncbi:MAG: RNA-binding domain-containing protein [Linnemannia gamsii]|nr:MAG: RNA-binding domain-containing protein [Linnemannia gamsii]
MDVVMTQAPPAEDTAMAGVASTSTEEAPAGAAAEATPVDNTPAPSPTLYIKNLNEKIKLDVLKKSLKALFGQYGQVLEIVAHANIRMRGQAFVVFEDKDSAAKALAEVQSFPLYGKPMVIQFSKNKSDAHAKKDGDFEEHHKERLLTKEKFANDFKHKKRQQKLQAKQQALLQEQQRFQEEQQAKQQAHQLLMQQQQQHFQHSHHAHPHAQQQYPPYGGAGAPSSLQQPGGPGAGGVPMIPDEYLPRNSILFLQNLPQEDTTALEAQLNGLFQQYPGFKEVRMVPGKKGIAFVEYDNEYYSAAAKTALAEYEIAPEHKMKVTFARK